MLNNFALYRPQFLLLKSKFQNPNAFWKRPLNSSGSNCENFCRNLHRMNGYRQLPVSPKTRLIFVQFAATKNLIRASKSRFWRMQNHLTKYFAKVAF